MVLGHLQRTKISQNKSLKRKTKLVPAYNAMVLGHLQRTKISQRTKLVPANNATIYFISNFV